MQLSNRSNSYRGGASTARSLTGHEDPTAHRALEGGDPTDVQVHACGSGLPVIPADVRAMLARIAPAKRGRRA